MKRLVPIMTALLLAGCDVSEPAPTTTMTPSVRLAAVPGRPAAGYFEFPIHGDRGALVSVTSPQAGRIEMHETRMAGSTSSMRPLARIPVRDGEMLRLVSGSRHLMLYEVDPEVRRGGQITLTLNFERGPPERLAAVVLSAGGEAH